ncbi:hypothetical protein E4T47_02189 [Aureobasidium subglaciale]|nr:hypothetical protein E4T47_02189 [Aureobasidium subglaciale]
MPTFLPEPVMSPESTSWTRGLTIARLKHEDTSWVDEQDLDVEQYIYVVDDKDAKLRVPENKGHEAMVYLTYIIDFYDSLPDISIFMHAHRYSHHNNAILEHDAAAMIRNLSDERVMREGYVNMRCDLNPGCPTMLDQYGAFGEDKIWKDYIVELYQELSPGKSVPKQMSQPCCAQFAVSRERIRATVLSQYIHYRDWLLQLDGSDFATGRAFEYLWHYIFTGNAVNCPNEFACYCGTYGICFSSVGDQRRWFSLQEEIKVVKRQIEVLSENESIRNNAATLEMQKMLDSSIQELESEKEGLSNDAFERGRDPQARAKVASRL